MKRSQIVSSMSFWVIVFVLVLGVVIFLVSDWGQRIIGMGEETEAEIEKYQDYDKDGIMNFEDMCCPAVCKTDPALVEKSGPRKGCAPNQRVLPCNSKAKSCLKT